MVRAPRGVDQVDQVSAAGNMYATEVSGNKRPASGDRADLGENVAKKTRGNETGPGAAVAVVAESPRVPSPSNSLDANLHGSLSPEEVLSYRRRENQQAKNRELELMQAEFARLKKELAKMSATSAQDRDKLKEMKDRLEWTKKDLDNERKKCDAVFKTAEKQELTIADLESRIAHLSSQHREKWDDVRKKADEAFALADAGEKTRRIASLKQSMVDDPAICCCLELLAEKKALETDNRRLREESGAGLAKIEASMRELRSIVGEWETKYAEAVASHMRETQALDASLKTITQEKNELAAKLNSVMDQKKDLERELEKEKSEANPKHVAEMETKQAEISALNTKLAEKENEISALAERIDAYKKECEELSAKLELMSSKSESTSPLSDADTEEDTPSSMVEEEPVKLTDAEQAETNKLSLLRREIYIPINDSAETEAEVSGDVELCMRYQKYGMKQVDENFITIMHSFVRHLNQLKSDVIPLIQTPGDVAFVTALEFECSALTFCLARLLDAGKFLMSHTQVLQDTRVAASDIWVSEGHRTKIKDIWKGLCDKNSAELKTPKDFHVSGIAQIDVLSDVCPEHTLVEMVEVMDRLQLFVGKVYRKHMVGHMLPFIPDGIREFLIRMGLIQGYDISDINVKILRRLSNNLDVEAAYLCEVCSTKNHQNIQASVVLPSAFPKNGFQFVFRARSVSTQGPGDAAKASARILAQLKLQFADPETGNLPVFGHPYTRKKRLLPFPIQYAYAVVGLHTVVSIEEYLGEASMDRVLDADFCKQTAHASSNDSAVSVLSKSSAWNPAHRIAKPNFASLMKTIKTCFKDGCAVISELDRFGLCHRNLTMNNFVRDQKSGQWVVQSFYDACSRKDILVRESAPRKPDQTPDVEKWGEKVFIGRIRNNAHMSLHYVAATTGENEDKELCDAKKLWFNFTVEGRLWNFSNMKCRYPTGSFLRSLRGMTLIFVTDIIQWVRHTCADPFLCHIPVLYIISSILNATDPSRYIGYRTQKCTSGLVTADFVKFLDPEFLLWFEEWRDSEKDQEK